MQRVELDLVGLLELAQLLVQSLDMSLELLLSANVKYVVRNNKHGIHLEIFFLSSIKSQH